MSFESRLVARDPKIAINCAGSGEALIFLHGVGTTKTSWNAQLTFFRNTHFACAWDARGYGGSDDYEGELNFARDLTGDLATVLDDLKIQKAHIVGLSMGGLIAQCFYFAHPERVVSLVLAHTFPNFGALGEEFVSRFVATRLQPLLEGAEPSDHAQETVDALLGPNASEESRREFLESLSALRKAPYVKTLRALVAQPAPGALEEIRVPTLILTGDYDKLSPPGLADKMKARVPGCRKSIIADCGHLSNIERPAEFNSIVYPFIAQHSGIASRTFAA